MYVVISGLLLALPVFAPQQATDRFANEIVINASVDEVWTVYTTKAGLESWMAPHADVELVVGGKLRTHFNPSGKLGDPETIEHTIISFEPKRMLSLRVAKPPASLPYPKAVQRIWSVVYFTPDGDRTRVTEVTMGFGDDTESQQLRQFLVEGNRYLFSQLERRFVLRPPN